MTGMPGGGGPVLLGVQTEESETGDKIEIVDPARVRVEVVTVSKRASEAEFRMRLDTVEVWYREHCSAVFDRDKLRAWLTSPRRWVGEGEVVLSVDPRSAGDRIAISLPDVAAWTLSPKELAALRVRV